jgi:hypothetical protein
MELKNNEIKPSCTCRNNSGALCHSCIEEWQKARKNKFFKNDCRIRQFSTISFIFIYSTRFSLSPPASFPSRFFLLARRRRLEFL